MPDIHDFRFVTNQQKRQIGGTIMEERKYTFYDRYQKVKYANITAEELEVLNISYNKEHYMFDQQHQRNNTVLFCGLESENSCATDFIADDGRDIASDITDQGIRSSSSAGFIFPFTSQRFGSSVRICRK